MQAPFLTTARALSSRAGSSRVAGFTLVEIVMVVLILGVLSATALPKFLNLGSQAHHAVLKNIASTLLSQAEMVRQVARVRGIGAVDYGVSLDVGAGTIVSNGGLPNETWHQSWKHLLDIDVRDLTFNGTTAARAITQCDAQGADFCVNVLDRDGGLGLYIYPDNYSVEQNCYARYLLKTAVGNYSYTATSNTSGC